jgi:hypothetical protein
MSGKRYSATLHRRGGITMGIEVPDPIPEAIARPAEVDVPGQPGTPSAGDRVLGFVASTGDRDLLTVETSRGAEQTIRTAKYEVTGRGGKGRELQRGAVHARRLFDPGSVRGDSTNGARQRGAAVDSKQPHPHPLSRDENRPVYTYSTPRAARRLPARVAFRRPARSSAAASTAAASQKSGLGQATMGRGSALLT